MYCARAGTGIEVPVGGVVGEDIGGTGVDNGDAFVTEGRRVGMESGVGVEQELRRAISKTKSIER